MSTIDRAPRTPPQTRTKFQRKGIRTRVRLVRAVIAKITAARAMVMAT